MDFSTLVRAHAALDLLLGAGMVFRLDETAALVHDKATAKALIGDPSAADGAALLVRTSESLVGVLLADVGVLLLAVSTVKEEPSRRTFCKAALATHAAMAAWRLGVQRRVPALSGAWQAQLAGDALLAATWASYLWGGAAARAVRGFVARRRPPEKGS